MAGRPTIPGWRYEAACWDCKERVKGSEREVEDWIQTPCVIAGSYRHSCAATPCYLNDGNFQCSRCRRNYVRIEGGQATEDMCDFCLAKGLTAKPVKIDSPRTAPCGHPVSFTGNDGYGRYHSHPRKRFLLRGEGWACCIPTSTYNTLDGRQEFGCGKRATYHVTLPDGWGLPGGADGSHCGMMCTRHANEVTKQAGTMSPI